MVWATGEEMAAATAKLHGGLEAHQPVHHFLAEGVGSGASSDGASSDSRGEELLAGMMLAWYIGGWLPLFPFPFRLPPERRQK